MGETVIKLIIQKIPALNRQEDYLKTHKVLSGRAAFRHPAGIKPEKRGSVLEKIGENVKNQKDYTNHKGFTLVELIVVIVILAILAAILIPGLLKWIDQAKQKQCELEARNIYLATEASLAELQAWGIEGTYGGKPVDVTELETDVIINYLTDVKDDGDYRYHHKWLEYIREMSGEKVDFIHVYIHNGKVEALLIRYVSSTNSENYIMASIRGTDAEYYENHIKGKWLAADSWGFGEWDWSDAGTWVFKEGKPLENKDKNN